MDGVTKETIAGVTFRRDLIVHNGVCICRGRKFILGREPYSYQLCPACQYENGEPTAEGLKFWESFDGI